VATLREEHMLVVSQMARVGRDAPAGLAEGLRVPHKRTALHRTLANAHGMANIAARHARWFVSQGLQPDFVADFRAAIKAVEDIAPQRHRLIRRQLRASASIQEKLSHGKRLVLALDAAIGTRLKPSPALR